MVEYDGPPGDASVDRGHDLTPGVEVPDLTQVDPETAFLRRWRRIATPASVADHHDDGALEDDAVTRALDYGDLVLHVTLSCSA